MGTRLQDVSLVSDKLVSIQLGSPASGDQDWYYEMASRIKKFPFNWDPQRVGTTEVQDGDLYVFGFPFNWDPQRVGTVRVTPKTLTESGVSIQLGSPASGDIGEYNGTGTITEKFPFNWDPQQVGTNLCTNAVQASTQRCFHSIGIPSEWGRISLTPLAVSLWRSGFHSIGIPSEWGQPCYRDQIWGDICKVSIQLGSPASGDFLEVIK